MKFRAIFKRRPSSAPEGGPDEDDQTKRLSQDNVGVPSWGGGYTPGGIAAGEAVGTAADDLASFKPPSDPAR